MERHFTLPWGAGAERFVKFSRAEGPGGTTRPLGAVLGRVVRSARALATAQPGGPVAHVISVSQRGGQGAVAGVTSTDCLLALGHSGTAPI